MITAAYYVSPAHDTLVLVDDDGDFMAYATEDFTHAYTYTGTRSEPYKPKRAGRKPLDPEVLKARAEQRFAKRIAESENKAATHKYLEQEMLRAQAERFAARQAFLAWTQYEGDDPTTLQLFMSTQEAAQWAGVDPDALQVHLAAQGVSAYRMWGVCFYRKVDLLQWKFDNTYKEQKWPNIATQK